MFHQAWLPEADIGALQQTLTAWQNLGEPFHLLAFLEEKDAHRVAPLQQLCADMGLTLAGALFPQLLANGQCGVGGILLLRVVAAPPPLLLADMADASRVDAAAKQLADYVELQLGAEEDASLFCIFDAMVPNVATHLDAWYLALADRVNYFGVNAGSETFTAIPCLFDNQRFLGDGVLLQLLPGHPGACLSHGYGVPDSHITATSAEGNRIVQIDWQPPLQIYSELMRSCYGVEITQDNFYENAVHFPFGILRADGEVLVRIPVALGDDGSIYCVGEIPPNAILTLLDAREANQRTPLQLSAELVASGGLLREGDLLLFYCAGRRMHMGAAVHDELALLQQVSGAHNVFGALSLGEIGGARSGGYPLFHNATIVAVPCR